jgi:hypothetical protein
LISHLTLKYLSHDQPKKKLIELYTTCDINL